MGKKDDPMQVLLVVAVAALSAVLLYKGGIYISALIESAKESWFARPKSEQFFTYGFCVVGLIALTIFGMGTLLKEKPHEGVALTKILVSLLSVLWAFCWMAAIFYGFLEKIGGIR